MKLQISFELLLYISLAGIALLFGVIMLASRWGGINGSIGSFGIYYFINSLNEQLSTGTSYFDLYVPPGICNSTVSGSKVETAYGTYYITSGINVSKGAFCPDGVGANFTVSYVSGRWVLGR